MTTENTKRATTRSAPKTKRNTAKPSQKKALAPYKLMLLVTVVPRNKAEFYLDLLQNFEVNMQLEVAAFGTAVKTFGFFDTDREKQVLFSIIREDNAANALATLEDKFGTLRGGKGIAYTVPFSSMVGVSAYKFLSNKQ